MNLELSPTIPDVKGSSAGSGPQFIPEASKNVTALAGRVASLTCRIKNLDNWTVRLFKWAFVVIRPSLVILVAMAAALYGIVALVGDGA